MTAGLLSSPAGLQLGLEFRLVVGAPAHVAEDLEDAGQHDEVQQRDQARARGVGYARCARLWNPELVHLLPADRSDHRVIDAERICQAIAALDSPEAIRARARQFAVLADPTRLTLLTCIRAAGPISVSDLAAATGINDATVSQTLRYLRASQTVIAEREGRVVRYRLASTPITALLADRTGRPVAP